MQPLKSRKIHLIHIAIETMFKIYKISQYRCSVNPYLCLCCCINCPCKASVFCILYNSECLTCFWLCMHLLWKRISSLRTKKLSIYQHNRLPEPSHSPGIYYFIYIFIFFTTPHNFGCSCAQMELLPGRDFHYCCNIYRLFSKVKTARSKTGSGC